MIPHNLGLATIPGSLVRVSGQTAKGANRANIINSIVISVKNRSRDSVSKFLCLIHLTSL